MDEARPVADHPTGIRWETVAAACWLLVGGLLAILVITDGWPSWRLARLGLVGAWTVLGAWLLRAHPLASGAAGLVLGVVGVVVGAVVGVLAWAAAGVSARPLLAVATLPAALVLLVASGAAAARALGRRRPTVITPGLVGIVLVGYVVAPGVLATNAVRVEHGAETPASRGVAYEDVTLRTEDGLTLTAWYVPSRNRAAVVVRHGSHSSASGVLDHLVVLADAGFGVLAPDARGHGGSDGQGMDFGWLGDRDIRAGVDVLAARPDVDPRRIGVIGISLGGMEAIGAAGRDPRVAAVVAEGAVRRSARDLSWLPEVEGPLGWADLAVNWLQTGVTVVLCGGPPPPSLADSVSDATATRFLLLTADSTLEVHAAAVVRARTPQRVEVHPFPGVQHSQGLASRPEEWTNAVLGFLTDSLLVRPGSRA
jgi:pimeloyl-ACP methyl ester carboxylesterase